MYTDSDLLHQNPGQAIALMEEDVPVVVRPPAGSPVTLPVEALGEALEIAQQATPELAATGAYADWSCTPVPPSGISTRRKSSRCASASTESRFNC